MSALGPENAKLFLKKLDAQKLLDLCADILFIEGHRDIRITDGMGDGQRDLRSITPTGEEYLVQSKYHENPKKAVSALEIGEVAVGMVRFGYKKGLFITTGRITPQAKRDLLGDGNFPDLKIDFLEGWEIAKKVFGNLVLKAIWYDGLSLDKVSYTLAIPVVARDLQTDKPLPILTRGQDNLQGKAIQVGDTNALSLLQKGRVSTEAFGEYRPPTVRTVSEFGTKNIGLVEVILSGVIHLKDIEKILDSVAKQIVALLENQYHSQKHFAVLVGYPSITPLGGELSGAHIQLENYEPLVYVSHNGNLETEFEWIFPPDSSWVLPEHATISQAEWIRWYNRKLDLCLDITITSPPGDSTRWMMDEQKNFIIKWWEKSLFALISQEGKNSLAKMGVPEPSHWHQWNETQFLGVWLHPYLGLPIAQMDIEPDHEPLESLPFGPDLEKVHFEQKLWTKKIINSGGKVVLPEKARHMIAIIDKYPFPVEVQGIFHCKDIARSDRIIPSPIAPISRQIVFTICWLINSENKSIDLIKAEILALSDARFQVFVEYDRETISQTQFLVIDIQPRITNIFASTQLILREIETELVAFLLQIESVLKNRLAVRRATEVYWDEEILINFNAANTKL
jgi:hypothetical protein